MSNRVLVLGNGIIGKQVKIAATKLGYTVATADIKGATYTFDLRNQEEYLEVLNEWRPNIIFNTAGKDQKLGDDAKPLHEMDKDEWDNLFGHNTDLLFNVARTSLAYLTTSNKKNKKLIFTPSTYSFMSPNPNFYDDNFVKSFAYVGSQSVYVNLVQYVAKHYARYNITCNGLVPHLVMQEVKDVDTTYSPIGRTCEPKELMPILKMLMDEDNTYMTGEFIKINGGWLC
jgi:NAD(P)-dependent dehydrogenase (short-subunit alcohol dehydrogenase family)